MFNRRGSGGGDSVKTPTTPSSTTSPSFPLFGGDHGGPWPITRSPQYDPNRRRQSVISVMAEHGSSRRASSSASFFTSSPSSLSFPSPPVPSSIEPATSEIDEKMAALSTAIPLPITRPLPLRPGRDSKVGVGGNNGHNTNRVTKQHQQQNTRSPSPLSPPASSTTRHHPEPTKRKQQPASRTKLPSPSPSRRSHHHHHHHHHHHPKDAQTRPTGSKTQTAYRKAISHLSTKLVPLISVTTGEAHPSFPRSILQYHLLTHDQLDELAEYYHQVYPAVRETGQYPIQIPAWLVVSRSGRGSGLRVYVDNDDDDYSSSSEAVADEDVDLDTKRRRWGRFLGLRGCESPVHRHQGSPPDSTAQMDGAGKLEREEEERREERRMRERLEREWQRAMEWRREEERLRDKAEGWRYRW